MTPDETVALYEQGQQAWNAWAKNMRDLRQALVEAGEIYRFSRNKATAEWDAAATANFKNYRFCKAAEFVGFEFPGTVTFSDATFVDDAVFRGVTFNGDAEFSGAVFKGCAMFKGAIFVDKASFQGAIFKDYTELSGATFGRSATFNDGAFNGEANFSDAIFEGTTKFEGVIFKRKAGFFNSEFGDVTFEGTIFENDAWFEKANFEAHAKFAGVVFEKIANFESTTFIGGAQFELARFDGYTTFDYAHFLQIAVFKAVRSTSAFSLAQMTFWVVPDFGQAHFDEAPRLDNLMIEPHGRNRPTRFEVLIYFGLKSPMQISRRRKKLRVVKKNWSASPLRGARNRDRSAHWRSLKRLAVQAHDHSRERDFFRREMIARRFVEDQPWNAVFWVGLLYQVLSNFGSSIFRPVVWLSISTVVFAGLYLGAHLKAMDIDTQPGSGLGSHVEHAAKVVGLGNALELKCIAGSGSPPFAALHLSLHNMLLLPALGAGEELGQIYACLYGMDSPELQSEGRLTPPLRVNNPKSVILFGLLQGLISAVLLFLLLLAIRSHFRIT